MVIFSFVAIPSPGFAQIKWIRTPADVTASQKDLYPPSYYGYALDVTNPSYFGGGNYTHNYGYTRGTGVADFPGNVPGPRQIPDRRPVFTSYPENGEYYVRAGQIVSETTLNPGNCGRFQITAPENAQIWIEGKPTTQQGSQRHFASACPKDQPLAERGHRRHPRVQRDGEFQPRRRRHSSAFAPLFCDALIAAHGLLLVILSMAVLIVVRFNLVTQNRTGLGDLSPATHKQSI